MLVSRAKQQNKIRGKEVKKPESKRVKNCVAGFVLCAAALPLSVATAAITWQFDYTDVIVGTGIGFDDATLGATRR